ncbi:MAG TPA: ABC transporter ATP-binding protein [Pseudonocardiaceae bacterium]|jgi:peptide/nickel transport system ATP-binding protein
MTSLLTVSELHVTYGDHPAVAGIDLNLDRGEVLALVGESGSGKSTAAHAIIGLLPGAARVEAGTVRFDGLDLTRLRERGMRAIRGREIGLVPQDPTVSLNPTRRLGDQVAEALTVHGLADRRAARSQAVRLLADAGLPDPELRARQFPHELSGGMRQRVLIAIALAAEPKLLIADEPTSALDVTVQRHILDHIDSATRKLGTSVLLITHDLAVAADRAHRIAVLRAGRIVETGSTDEVLHAPRHEYTRALVAAAPGLRPPITIVPRVPDDFAAAATPLLVATGLTKEFPLGRRIVRAVDGVDLTVHSGQTVALVGESGSGKSTTARLVLRLATPTEGRIVFAGTDITDLRGPRLRRLRQRMQLVHQNPYSSLDPRQSIAEIIAEPLRVFRVGDRAARAATVRGLLDRVGLPDTMLRRKPAELSGGQRQRVAIARALALGPSLVVCDEPVSALDVLAQRKVLELLAELQSDLGVAYLFISHDLAVIREIADDVVVLSGGKVVESGPVGDVLTDPKHDYTKALLDAVPGRASKENTPS